MLISVALFISGCLIFGFSASGVFGRNKQLFVLLNFDWNGDLHEEGLGALYQAAVIVMVVSGLIVLLSFLGFAGVLLGNQAMLNIYTASLFLVVFMQISTLFVIYAYQLQMQQYVQKNLREQLLKSMEEHYDGRFNSPHPFSVALDYAQVYFGCCGITGYIDFKKTRWKGEVIFTEPPSKQTAAEGGNATAVITTEPPSNQTAVEGGNATTTTDTSSHSVSEFPITCCRLKDPAAFLGAVSEWGSKVETFHPTCHKRLPSRDNEYTGFPCIEKVRHFLMSKVEIVVYSITAVIGMEVSGAMSASVIVRDIQDRQIP